MELIKCPACGHDVSDQATSCPNCGQPLGATELQTVVNVPAEDSIQTIQLTKKKWKKLRLWGIGFFVLGIFLMLNHMWPIGALFWVIAIIIGIIANIGSWWSTG